MNHEQFQELVSLYLDEGLTDAESAQMFGHLGECGECRNFMRSSMRVRSYYQQQELEEIPLSLDRRVAASAGMMQAPSHRPHFLTPIWTTRLSIPVPVAASIIFLILVGTLLFSPLLFQESKFYGDNRTEIMSHVPPELQQQLKLFR
jgi:predicted anti-sigma-YlaC factor YlaD